MHSKFFTFNKHFLKLNGNFLSQFYPTLLTLYTARIKENTTSRKTELTDYLIQIHVFLNKEIISLPKPQFSQHWLEIRLRFS